MHPRHYPTKSPLPPVIGQITSNQHSHTWARHANPSLPKEEIVVDGEGWRAASEYSSMSFTRTAQGYAPRPPLSRPIPPLPPDQQREFGATTSKTCATGIHIGEVEGYAPKPAAHKTPMPPAGFRPSLISPVPDPLSATGDKDSPKGPFPHYPTKYPHPDVIKLVTFDERSRYQARHSSPSLPTEKVVAITSKTHVMGKHIGEVESHAPNAVKSTSLTYADIMRMPGPLSRDLVKDSPKGDSADRGINILGAYGTTRPVIPPRHFPTKSPHPHLIEQITVKQHSRLWAQDASPSLPTEKVVATTSKTHVMGKHIEEVEGQRPNAIRSKSLTYADITRMPGPLSRDLVKDSPKGDSVDRGINNLGAHGTARPVIPPRHYPTKSPHPRLIDPVTDNQHSRPRAQDASPSLPTEEAIATASKTTATGKHIGEVEDHAPNPTAHKTPMPAADTDIISPVPDPLSAPLERVKDSPKGDKAGRRMDVIGDHIATVESKAAPFIQPIAKAANAIGQTDIGKTIKEGIDHFFDGMPVLMKALDKLAELHPFIAVVVTVFKTVYNLEQKRRDNEKKIIALYVQMKDIMEILLLLNNVTEGDLKLLATDGRSIKARLKSLVERTAEDIMSCSNVCDAYAKKRLLAKVFQGPAWNVKLLDWATLFSKRRKDFMVELTIHTNRGVDEANAKLEALDKKLEAFDKKMSDMFEQLVSPEQKRVAATVGNGSVMALSDSVLLEVEKTSSKAPPSADMHQALSSRATPTDMNVNVDDLRADICEDPDAAVEKNKAMYILKFEEQKLQITELASAIERQGDRLFEEISGPRQRIRDRIMHEIWSDMGSRGSVKARHFVLALRDHYVEKLAAEAEGDPVMGTALLDTSRNLDAWAIKFIDVTRLRPISEAFDDDASGFITISEMNRFTGSRPPDWSLPHWIAFWAVGYKASIIDYANKIEDLFAKMEGTRVEVLPPNQKFFDNYFTFAWKLVHTLTAAVTPLEPELGTSNLERFKSYLEAEETRLSASLKAMNYNIDGTDTLTLITGAGRIEKTVLPLIYLLMKRHYEIMRAMRTKLLDWRELGSGVESFVNVKDAIQYRVNDLTSIFSHQKLKPEKEFQNFAYGIFKYFHNKKDLWSSEYVRTLDPPVIPYTDTNEDQNVGQGEVLKYKPTDELLLDDWVYDGHSIDDPPNDRNVEPSLKDILGHWHGYFYKVDGTRESTGIDSMMTFVLEPADGGQKFKANAWSIRGQFTITGSWYKGEDDITKIEFKMTFQRFQSVSWSVFFYGQFDAGRDALTGVWSLLAGPENRCGQMEFRRIPPHYLTIYPSIKALSDNHLKSRALWGFAIAAVLNDIRRKHWSWSYFSQRRKDRVTVISLGIRYWHFGTPVNHEDQPRTAAAQRLTAADALFYFSKINRTAAYARVHTNAWCNRCYGRIGGARLFCLDCDHKDTETFVTLDLCCAQKCMNARITDRQDLKVAHEPTHRLVKVRTVVLERRLGRVHTAALMAFGRVKILCAKIAESHQRFVEDDEEGEATGPDTRNQSNPKPTPEDALTESDDGLPLDHAPDVPNDTTVDGGASKGLRSESLQDGKRPQDSDSLPCGKCRGRLSFPCWYCIYCKDDLFLCEACDREGDFELMRGSGKHTEDHHLIRCLAPEKDDDVLSPTERRLISLESRMQSQFDNMESRFGDLTTRIGNMEQLLHRLSGAETVA